MDVPVCEKYTLTLREAAAYFSIGEKRRRQYSFYLRKRIYTPFTPFEGELPDE